MVSFFKKSKHPKNRQVYAVTKGLYLGELLVYIKTENQNFEFLSIPKMCNRQIPKDKFEFGLKEKIVDVVTKVPKYVHNVCKQQYIKNQTGEKKVDSIN